MATCHAGAVKYRDLSAGDAKYRVSTLIPTPWKRDAPRLHGAGNHVPGS
jgi:hypothetical protein